jgi:putative ABC transport system substrate-binding protein
LIRYRVPAIFTSSAFIAAGGLTSYGPDALVMYRQSASYVDRILRGEKPGDLPFQQPTSYRLLINLKTATRLGLTVPDALLVAADEVIE